MYLSLFDVLFMLLLHYLQAKTKNIKEKEEKLPTVKKRSSDVHIKFVRKRS